MAGKKSAITYQGGKARHAEIIVPLVEGYGGYVEPFAGSAEILLQKEPTKREVINDTAGELVNFFRIVRFHKDALLDYLEWMPNSREEFYEFVQHEGLTDIQRAARWFKRNKLSFGGDMEHFGTSRTNGTGYRSNRWEKIEWLNKRLDRVAIENLDYEDCISRYEHKNTVLFVDPPYLLTSNLTYDCWDLTQHTALRDRLAKATSPWVMTVNDTPKLRELYSDYTVETFSQRYYIHQGTRDKKSDQLLIHNT